MAIVISRDDETAESSLNHGSARMAAGFDGRSAGIEKLTDNYDNTIVRLTLNAPASVSASLFLAGSGPHQPPPQNVTALRR